MNTPRQVVILCGGLGTRLKNLTQTLPKSMMPISGKPFLERQLELFLGQGFHEFLFLTGYLSQSIENHFGDGRKWNAQISYSREPEPMGTGGALRLAQDQLNDSFILAYGDSYLAMDYNVLAHDFARHDCEIDLVIFRDKTRATGVTPNVAWNPDGLVSAYAKDQADNAALLYIDAGALAVDKKVTARFDALPSAFSFEKEIFPQLIAEKKLRGFVSSERFYDIGTLERLAVFSERCG